MSEGVDEVRLQAKKTRRAVARTAVCIIAAMFLVGFVLADSAIIQIGLLICAIIYTIVAVAFAQDGYCRAAVNLLPRVSIKTVEEELRGGGI